MDEREAREIEKAKEILQAFEAGTQPPGPAVDYAKKRLGLGTEPAATSSNASGTMNKDFAAQIVGKNSAGEEVSLAACLKAESWAGVKTFTPFGERMREIIVDFRASVDLDAASGSETAIILGTTAAGREVSLADVEKEGLALFASLAKLTDVGAAARDDLLALETERASKAAGVHSPDLPALRAAVAKGIAGWTGSPWGHTVDEGIRAEIENRTILAHDHRHEHNNVRSDGTLGLATYPKGPGKLAASAPAELIAKAKALGIDVNAVEGAALAVNMDPVEALKAEVFNQELLARDRERTAPVDGVIGSRSR
ncbi:MAG: hypothetical protein ABSG38_16440 [Spirochaetia bacterium]|jgi:hypothetical protein